VAIGHAFLFAMALALWLVDDRQLGGVNVWIKPMKFALSVALYTATFGWIYYYAEASPGAKAAVSWVITLTLVYEIVCVLGQAGRGVGSYFNISTSFDALCLVRWE